MIESSSFSSPVLARLPSSSTRMPTESVCDISILSMDPANQVMSRDFEADS